MDHTPGNCPVCNKPLRKGEDIVTCPSCGAQYHRACYGQAGNCVFSAQHGPGFEYAPPGQADTKPAAAKNQGGVLCPHCQTVNEAKNIFCENCGQPLHTNVRRASAAGPATGPAAPPPLFGGTGGAYAGPMAWGYGPQAAYSGTIAGVPSAEWAEFVGSAAPVYLPRLAAMERQKSKVSFLFSAFFISPVFFAYRKMWNWAALSLLATLVFFVPQLVMIAATQGMALPFALPLETLQIISSVASYLDLGMRLAFGMFGLFLYQGFASKKIAQIRKENTGNLEYHSALIRQGGTSSLGAALVVGAVFASSMVAYYFMGDALQAYFYPGLFI